MNNFEPLSNKISKDMEVYISSLNNINGEIKDLCGIPNNFLYKKSYSKIKKLFFKIINLFKYEK